MNYFHYIFELLRRLSRSVPGKLKTDYPMHSIVEVKCDQSIFPSFIKLIYCIPSTIEEPIIHCLKVCPKYTLPYRK